MLHDQSSSSVYSRGQRAKWLQHQSSAGRCCGIVRYQFTPKQSVTSAAHGLHGNSHISSFTVPSSFRRPTLSCKLRLAKLSVPESFNTKRVKRVYVCPACGVVRGAVIYGSRSEGITKSDTALSCEIQKAEQSVSLFCLLDCQLQ